MKIMNTEDVVSKLSGGQCEFARICDMKQPSVSYRVKHGLPVSGEEAVLIEESAGISRHVIRPDIFGEQAA